MGGGLRGDERVGGLWEGSEEGLGGREEGGEGGETGGEGFAVEGGGGKGRNSVLNHSEELVRLPLDFARFPEDVFGSLPLSD